MPDRPRSVNWYTIYDAQTDEIIACGDADMIVQQMGYSSRNAFFSAVCHSKKQPRQNRRYIYHVEKVSRASWRKMQRKV